MIESTHLKASTDWPNPVCTDCDRVVLVTVECINPEHLEPVTQWENVRRSSSKSAENMAKTHCLRGHEFTEENTRPVKKGRQCKKCEYIRNKRRRLAQ